MNVLPCRYAGQQYQTHWPPGNPTYRRNFGRIGYYLGNCFWKSIGFWTAVCRAYVRDLYFRLFFLPIFSNAAMVLPPRMGEFKMNLSGWRPIFGLAHFISISIIMISTGIKLGKPTIPLGIKTAPKGLI